MPTIQKPKKIIFVITKSNWGGAQRYVFDIATHLQKDAFEVSVALGGTGSARAAPGALLEKLKRADIRSVLIPHFRRDMSLVSEVHAFFELLSLFQKERPDIVHLNSSKAGGLGALAARIAAVPKIIFTIHGLPFEEERPRWQNALIKIATYITCILASHIIVLSERAVKKLASLPYAAEKIQVMPLGIEQPTFVPCAEARATLSEKSGVLLQEETPLIFSIGELHKNKGYDIALRALAELRKKNITFTYLIAGEGEERKNLETLIAELDLSAHVHLLGFLPDAAQYLRGADLFLLPSRKEGMPYVLLEALYAETPIIASAVGDVPIVLHETPEYLFSSGAVHNLEHVLARTLQQRYSVHARMNTTPQDKKNRYTLEVLLNTLCTLYRTP